MWLGLSAVFVAFSYALVKFLTSVHMRRLRDSHQRLHTEVKRDRQRLQAVENKLQVQRSQRGAVQQKLTNARRFKDELHSRLRRELPSSLLNDLAKCVNQHPIPEPEGVRTAHELRLADKVTEALTSLSILVVEIGGTDSDDGDGTVIAGLLVQRLTELEARFSGPEPRRGAADTDPHVLTTAFDDPASALDLMTTIGAAHPEQIAAVRAALVAGITVTQFDQEHVNRLFARTLHSTRSMLEEVGTGELVLNERAHELLGKRPDVSAREGADKLWSVRLGATAESSPESAEEEAATDQEPTADANTEAESVEPDAKTEARI